MGKRSKMRRALREFLLLALLYTALPPAHAQPGGIAGTALHDGGVPNREFHEHAFLEQDYHEPRSSTHATSTITTIRQSGRCSASCHLATKSFLIRKTICISRVAYGIARNRLAAMWWSHPRSVPRPPPCRLTTRR
jgi:hypothetical protein